MQESTLEDTQMFKHVTDLTVEKKTARFGEDRIELTIEHEDGSETLLLYGENLDQFQVGDNTIRYHSNNHS